MTTPTGTILIVEDIATLRELLELQLTLRGYTVVAAKDGQEALDIIERQPPAAIVADILMPRVDGFTLAHRLRSNPQTAHLPIIFLSATYISSEDERFALNLGALRFLPKPVEAEELVRALNEALTPPVSNEPEKEKDKPPLTEREFYIGYRQRLKAKLQQKRDQIARHQQRYASAPADQRDTYRHLLAEAHQQAEEIQRELDMLSQALQE